MYGSSTVSWRFKRVKKMTKIIITCSNNNKKLQRSSVEMEVEINTSHCYWIWLSFLTINQTWQVFRLCQETQKGWHTTATWLLVPSTSFVNRITFYKETTTFPFALWVHPSQQLRRWSDYCFQELRRLRLSCLVKYQHGAQEYDGGPEFIAISTKVSLSLICLSDFFFLFKKTKKEEEKTSALITSNHMYSEAQIS